MIPLWKLKRELRRPVDQLRSGMLYPFDKLTKWRHDRNFHSSIRMTRGDQPAGKKFAILLIYQPKGLAKSTLLTCRHLMDQGYTVLLISNAKLTEEGRAELAPVTWRIVERPNVGYDFGGYRDGLRILHEAGLEMQALAIVNDSIWWPLCANDTAIQQIENLGVDMSGMILRPPGKPRKRQSNYAPHLQSYFFWFGPKALQSEAFANFWKDYHLSGFKYNAIRRGELQLTKVMLEAGLAVAPLFRLETLMERLHAQSWEYLRKVLHYGAFKDIATSKLAKALETSASSDPEWRAAVFNLFAQMTKTSEFHLALRYPSVDMMGLNFLKRSAAEPKNSMHHVGRGNYIDAIKNGDLPSPMPVVMAEIEERHRLGAVAIGR